jgi:hypothetical protein
MNSDYIDCTNRRLWSVRTRVHGDQRPGASRALRLRREGLKGMAATGHNAPRLAAPVGPGRPPAVQPSARQICGGGARDETTNTTEGSTMGMQENKQAAQDAYAAFSSGTATPRARCVTSTTRSVDGCASDNALTGTYSGKQAVGGCGSSHEQGLPHRAHDYVAMATRSSSSPRSTSTASRLRTPTSSPHCNAGKLDRVRHARRAGVATECSPVERPSPASFCFSRRAGGPPSRVMRRASGAVSD